MCRQHDSMSADNLVIFGGFNTPQPLYKYVNKKKTAEE